MHFPSATSITDPQTDVDDALKRILMGLTVSAYKLAIDCPTKLYYCCDDSYANQDEDNEFMESLADGGL